MGLSFVRVIFCWRYLWHEMDDATLIRIKQIREVAWDFRIVSRIEKARPDVSERASMY